MVDTNQQSNRYGWQSETSIVDVMRSHATNDPDSSPCLFLDFGADGLTTERTPTFAELDVRARAAAAAIQNVSKPGDAALLLYPPGEDFMVGFLACLYAGLIAIPAYPPDPYRMERSVPRLRSMIKDADARLILSNTLMAGLRDSIVNHAPELQQFPWIATDANYEAAYATSWKRPDFSGNQPAVLQYTSGSTGMPKGVMLSHANIVGYLAMICESDPESVAEGQRGLMWSPTYHDMGLVQGVLLPAYIRQKPLVVMSPIAFLQRPGRWLEAVSCYRATYSGGPNFAFDLCVDKTTPDEREGLDLSSWEVAFCSAEPVRKKTMDRFVATFRSKGFNPGAFRPAYGLAEATLVATLAKRSHVPVVRAWRTDDLEQGVAVADSGSEASQVQELVGCGTPISGVELRVVNPRTKRECSACEVGEIWLAGPGIATGYWKKPVETEELLNARLASEQEKRFLRTGDLGFVDHDGELFVTGRRKDILIIRGRNIYPQDVEAVVEQAEPKLRRGCGAAFAVDSGGSEGIGVAYEINPAQAADPDPIFARIRRAVAETFGVQLDAIVLLPPHAMFKTSSGKLQRNECRKTYAAGQLPCVAQWQRPRVPEPMAEAAQATE